MLGATFPGQAGETGVLKGQTARSVMRSSEALIMSEGIKGTPDTSIVNGTDWLDTEGRHIAVHDGGIARFNGVFYWYGTSSEV